MKLISPQHPNPDDHDERCAIKPVICYPVDTLPPANPVLFGTARENLTLIDSVTIPPRDAKAFKVPAGCYFRIISTEGSQVGDLNLWNANDHSEKFYNGKTRALHGTHLSTGDRM